jgi:hypothetical protein
MPLHPPQRDSDRLTNAGREAAERGNPMQPLPHTQPAPGTLDGDGAGAFDQPYAFGRRPRSDATGPFTLRQYSRLLALRSRVQAGLFGAGDLRVA